MDGPETWLMIVAGSLVVIGLFAHLVPTRKQSEDIVAYWKRKIAENGRKQQWGGR